MRAAASCRGVVTKEGGAASARHISGVRPLSRSPSSTATATAASDREAVEEGLPLPRALPTPATAADMADEGGGAAAYDQEVQLERLFHGLSKGFQVGRLPGPGCLGPPPRQPRWTHE